jgi:multidrug resistance efflux pump
LQHAARELEHQRDLVKGNVENLTRTVPQIQKRIDDLEALQAQSSAICKIALEMPAGVTSKIPHGAGAGRMGFSQRQEVPDVRDHLRFVCAGLDESVGRKLADLQSGLKTAKAKLKEDSAALKSVQAELDQAMEALA